jgi:HEAT repeat protein
MVKRKRQPRDVMALLGDLASAATFVRRSAIIELVEKGAPEAAGPLKSLLHDREAAIRACTAWALGELKVDDAAPALVQSLKDMDVDVRRAAVLSLVALARPESLEGLQSASVDSDRWVAEGARRGLARLQKLPLRRRRAPRPGTPLA